MADSDVVDRLTAALADLEGYVQRRAEELAAPLIEQAQAAADERVRKVLHDNERLSDLNAEHRRRLGPLLQQQEEAAEARDRLARALGHHPLGHWLLPLVAEAEARLAVEPGATEGTPS